MVKPAFEASVVEVLRGVEIEFLHDVSPVGLGGACADPKGRGHLAIGEAGAEQLEDLLLARGQFFFERFLFADERALPLGEPRTETCPPAVTICTAVRSTSGSSSLLDQTLREAAALRGARCSLRTTKRGGAPARRCAGR